MNNERLYYNSVEPKKKYGVGELPYLGCSALNWVHLFNDEQTRDAYYDLVIRSSMNSKISVRIIKFEVCDETCLNNGKNVLEDCYIKKENETNEMWFNSLSLVDKAKVIYRMPCGCCVHKKDGECHTFKCEDGIADWLRSVHEPEKK